MERKTSVELSASEWLAVSLLLAENLKFALENGLLNASEWEGYQSILSEILKAADCPWHPQHFVRNINAIAEQLSEGDTQSDS